MDFDSTKKGKKKIIHGPNLRMANTGDKLVRFMQFHDDLAKVARVCFLPPSTDNTQQNTHTQRLELAPTRVQGCVHMALGINDVNVIILLSIT